MKSLSSSIAKRTVQPRESVPTQKNAYSAHVSIVYFYHSLETPLSTAARRSPSVYNRNKSEYPPVRSIHILRSLSPVFFVSSSFSPLLPFFALMFFFIHSSVRSVLSWFASVRLPYLSRAAGICRVLGIFLSGPIQNLSPAFPLFSYILFPFLPSHPPSPYHIPFYSIIRVFVPLNLSPSNFRVNLSWIRLSCDGGWILRAPVDIEINQPSTNHQ